MENGINKLRAIYDHVEGESKNIKRIRKTHYRSLE